MNMIISPPLYFMGRTMLQSMLYAVRCITLRQKKDKKDHNDTTVEALTTRSRSQSRKPFKRKLLPVQAN